MLSMAISYMVIPVAIASKSAVATVASNCANAIYSTAKNTVLNTTNLTVDNNKVYIIVDGVPMECKMDTRYTITQCKVESDELMKSIL